MPAYALIPARGGSKGLPRKNILPLAGKPLIAYSIEAALNANEIDSVHVSSDSEEILEIAAKYNATPIKRPSELATDTASSDAVVAHFIEHQSLNAQDSVILLQPTSPLRVGDHIDKAVGLSKQSGRSVVAMSEPEECPFKGFKVDSEGLATGYFGKDAPFSRRQDHPTLLYANGSIYVFTVGDFMKENCIPRENISPFLMDKHSSVDIDSEEDLKFAEILLGQQK